MYNYICIFIDNTDYTCLYFTYFYSVSILRKWHVFLLSSYSHLLDFLIQMPLCSLRIFFLLFLLTIDFERALHKRQVKFWLWLDFWLLPWPGFGGAGLLLARSLRPHVYQGCGLMTAELTRPCCLFNDRLAWYHKSVMAAREVFKHRLLSHVPVLERRGRVWLLWP